MIKKKVWIIILSVLIISMISKSIWALSEKSNNQNLSSLLKNEIENDEEDSDAIIISDGKEVLAVNDKGINKSINGVTLKELGTYNGLNGNRSYVAVNGIVYDVTDIASWKNGEHKGMKAGNDLTKEFASSPHSSSILKELPVIGSLVNDSKVITKSNVEKVVNNEIWTLELLKNYNGKNGSSAFILVDGTIYDVTKLGNWSNGTHKGYVAGEDLSVAFSKSPHSASILSSAKIVGVMGEPVNINNTSQIKNSNLTIYTTKNLSDDDDDDDDDENENDENENDENDNDD